MSTRDCCTAEGVKRWSVTRLSISHSVMWHDRRLTVSHELLETNWVEYFILPVVLAAQWLLLLSTQYWWQVLRLFQNFINSFESWNVLCLNYNRLSIGQADPYPDEFDPNFAKRLGAQPRQKVVKMVRRVPNCKAPHLPSWGSWQ